MSQELREEELDEEVEQDAKSKDKTSSGGERLVNSFFQTNDAEDSDEEDESKSTIMSDTTSVKSKKTLSTAEPPLSPLSDSSQSSATSFTRDIENGIDLKGIKGNERRVSIREAWIDVKSFFDEMPLNYEDFFSKYGRSCTKYFGAESHQAFLVLDEIRKEIGERQTQITFAVLSDAQSQGGAIAMSEAHVPKIELSEKFYKLKLLDRYTTLIHELSHIFGETVDEEHSYVAPPLEGEALPSLTTEAIKEGLKERCKKLAKENPLQAAKNTYNYTFFLESVDYYKQKENKKSATSLTRDKLRELSSTVSHTMRDIAGVPGAALSRAWESIKGVTGPPGPALSRAWEGITGASSRVWEGITGPPGRELQIQKERKSFDQSVHIPKKIAHLGSVYHGDTTETSTNAMSSSSMSSSSYSFTPTNSLLPQTEQLAGISTANITSSLGGSSSNSAFTSIPITQKTNSSSNISSSGENFVGDFKPTPTPAVKDKTKMKNKEQQKKKKKKKKRKNDIASFLR